MHSKSNDIKIINCDKADENIEEIFKSLLNRYQNGFDKTMTFSSFTFDWVSLS